MTRNKRTGDGCNSTILDADELEHYTCTSLDAGGVFTVPRLVHASMPSVRIVIICHRCDGSGAPPLWNHYRRTPLSEGEGSWTNS